MCTISTSGEITTWWIKWENGESCLSCMRHAYWSSSSSLPNIIKLSQTELELWPAQDFGFRGNNEDSKSCLSCAQHVYWSSSTFLPNIIKVCLRVSKLWSAQGYGYNFCFRGDNFIMIAVRVFCFACDKPTGPPLHPYQMLSNYLTQYKSYGLHKILASGGITAYQRQWELSLLHATRLLVLFYIPTKYYQNMSKGIEVMDAQGCVYGRTEGRHADKEYPPNLSVGV